SNKKIFILCLFIDSQSGLSVLSSASISVAVLVLFYAKLQKNNYLVPVSTKYKIRDQEQLYFVSFATVYWLDLFVRNEYRELLLESLRYCQKEKGLEVYAWCIMTSHVHLIIGTSGNKME